MDAAGGWKRARCHRAKIVAPLSVRRDICRVDNVGSPPGAPLRLRSLDALRGICAGVVFLSHWYLWSDFPPANFIEHLIHRTGYVLHEAVVILTWPTGGHHPAVIGFFVL